jgi:hypothetical protein
MAVSRPLNPYKQSWLEKSGHGITYAPTSKRGSARRRKAIKSVTPYQMVGSVVEQQIKEAVALGLAMKGSRYASVANVQGRTGIVIRVAGKIGLRVVPVVGAVLMAKDIYSAYQFLTKD